MVKSGLKWVFLIVGTMIGAGYASGRELWQFFGPESGLAILLFAILFIISCQSILMISYRLKTTHYLPVLNNLVGKRFAKLYDGMIIIYLFSTTVIMLAGSGVTVQAYRLPTWFGILLIACLLIAVFQWDIKGVLVLNSFILPLLITGLVSVLISFVSKNGIVFENLLINQSNWLAAFPFTALNILPLIAVIGAIGSQIEHKKETYVASIGSGLILGSISMLYNSSLLQIADQVISFEMPLFGILAYYPYTMFLFITVLLWFAIFTTAVTGTLGLVTRIHNTFPIPLSKLVIIIVILMLPLTSLGFQTLIEVLYPLYGVLNLYILANLLLYPILHRYKLAEK